ncbi:MAG: hypothetical protein JWN44_7065 [Myxococcales bacterium]|nr:hypothetical protein [Myxococcales bacterium]
MRGLLLAALVLTLSGCPGSSLTDCGNEPDISGHWTLTFNPIVGGLQRSDTVEADLTQMKRPGSTFGSLLWGTLVSTDKGFFDSIDIPQLVDNNGSKTGALVSCELKINVPVTTVVTDDNAENGPLRLSLTGSVVARGMMTGDASTVIRVDNPAMMPETFTWSGIQR